MMSILVLDRLYGISIKPKFMKLCVTKPGFTHWVKPGFVTHNFINFAWIRNKPDEFVHRYFY